MDLKNWVSTFYFTPKKPGARNFEIDYSQPHNPNYNPLYHSHYPFSKRQSLSGLWRSRKAKH